MKEEKLLRVVSLALFVFLVVFVVLLVADIWRYMVETAKECNVTCFLNK